MVVFLFMINFIGALMVGARPHLTMLTRSKAVQLLRGDITAGDTITFSQTYNSFLGMYQVRVLHARWSIVWG